MPKQDWKTIISKLEKEIVALHGEIRKREEIVKNLKSLQGISGLGIPVRRERKPKAWTAGRKPVKKKAKTSWTSRTSRTTGTTGTTSSTGSTGTKAGSG